MGTSNENKALGVQFLEIDEEYAGQRLDNFLLTRLKGAPKSLIYRIVRKGEVRVNKGRIKPDYRLQAGDVLRIPPVRLGEKTPAKPSNQVLDRIASGILYEDKRILIINKPAGIAVHGGSGINFGVIEALRALRPEAPFLELVHRLDRDTSGCLIIAKKRSALRVLHDLLRENRMAKFYLALLRGEWRGGDRILDFPLRKNTLQSGERVVKVSADGKPARSLFSPQNTKAAASLVQVRLETGRTHQIRVHAAHAGFPIAGDEKYGDEEFNRQMKEQGLKRLFLHAHQLDFTFPDDGQRINITAPLPDDLKQVLIKLDMRNRV
ncbi:MAG: 23S rRNA pseudouridine(955/2504/2580) synthase RluC [Gammaproteobacteria bacterium]|nr:23S rRNA pseudouridine(955/2504/2580) synthase RluC [Gammaproteobacteria bacterium]MDH5652668.1 23S rRNA pseudouridine(955/2504/2580) synthase RluC [Gammaproteobacteria bacterium]